MHLMSNNPEANVHLTEYRVNETTQKISDMWFDLKADIQTVINGNTFMNAEEADVYIEKRVNEFAENNTLWACGAIEIDETNAVSYNSSSTRLLILADKDITCINNRNDNVRFFSIFINHTGMMAGTGAGAISKGGLTDDIEWGIDAQVAVKNISGGNKYWISGKRVKVGNRYFAIPSREYNSGQYEWFAQQIW